MVELVKTPSTLEAGDAALVNRGGTPEMVALGSAATADVDAFATAAETVIQIEGLGALASILGQVAQQVNGGQVTLRGGSLADPALRIGTVGIYSSATNTLSIAVAGTEVARFTASGLSVLGGTIGSL
jgi:predicted amino acid dehydrogenase